MRLDRGFLSKCLYFGTSVLALEHLLSETVSFKAILRENHAICSAGFLQQCLSLSGELLLALVSVFFFFFS